MKTILMMNLFLITSTLISFRAQANHSEADNNRRWEEFQQEKLLLNHEVKQYCNSSLKNVDLKEAGENISKTRDKIYTLMQSAEQLQYSADWTTKERQSLTRDSNVLKTHIQSCEKQVVNLYYQAKKRLNKEVAMYCTSATIYGSNYSEAFNAPANMVFKIDDQFYRLIQIKVGFEYFQNYIDVDMNLLLEDKDVLQKQKDDCFKRIRIVNEHFYPATSKP